MIFLGRQIKLIGGSGQRLTRRAGLFGLAGVGSAEVQDGLEDGRLKVGHGAAVVREANREHGRRFLKAGQDFLQLLLDDRFFLGLYLQHNKRKKLM